PAYNHHCAGIGIGLRTPVIISCRRITRRAMRRYSNATALKKLDFRWDTHLILDCIQFNWLLVSINHSIVDITMPERNYAAPAAGLPSQHVRTVDRAVFKTAYAVIPSAVMRDIVTSRLPHWTDTRAWILARPLSGFAETFAQYIVEIAPGGGSDTPEPEQGAEAVLFVLNGNPTLSLDDKQYELRAGSYVFIGPKSRWAVHNNGTQAAN